MRSGPNRGAAVKHPDAAGRVEPDKPGRLPHRQLEEVREIDPEGRIVVHHRTVDTLGKMLHAGTITQEMHDAARAFQAAFFIANLDPIRAAPILRVPGTRARARPERAADRCARARARNYAGAG
jgi:hypothetical protein